MSSLFDKAKSKLSGSESSENQEQQFTIQPHPAKTNDPADLQRDPAQMGPGYGLGGQQPEVQAHHARGPHVPSKDIVDTLEMPASREELAARQRELNPDQ